MRTVTIAFSGSLFLAGCASSLSGLSGSSQFTCPAPDGVSCSSLSTIYAKAVTNDLPMLRNGDNGDGGEKSEVADKKGANYHEDIIGRAPESGSPIRTQPKVLRVWLAPWEDTDGDLHDQSYIYVVIDPGRWIIEHNQQRIIDRYRPLFTSEKTAGTTDTQQPASGGVTLPGRQMAKPE